MQFRYRLVFGGLPEELSVLQAEEVVDHLRNYLGNFLLDPTVCSVYLNRLLKEAPKKASPRVSSWTFYLITRMLEMSPLNVSVARIAGQFGLSVSYLNDLLRCTLPSSVTPKLASALSAPTLRDARNGLLTLLRVYPYSVELIEPLLRIELNMGIPVGSEWVDMVKLPERMKPLLYQSLFMYCLMQRDINRAAVFFYKWNLTQAGPYVLNHVAEFFAASGLTGNALKTYERSYWLDPIQVPVKYRIEALANGTHRTKGDLSGPIAVCLYSYNKEDFLDKTLHTLAESNLGNARIFVLLNGCTDSSEERVKARKVRFFGTRMTVISLPVNIGAPAARNWLLALPEVKTSRYVAFLDDDVEIPSTWLESLVGVLESHPLAGVAGVKVLCPGEPPRLQYLYRNVAVARSDLIRISLDVPNWNYDVGFYDFTRPTVNVMGCCHVFKREALDAVQYFDIRFSPSQMDDIAHDLELALAGYQVIYHGLVACIHHQMSGIGLASKHVDFSKLGNGIGNDVKFSYLFADRLDQLRELNNLRLVPGQPGRVVRTECEQTIE